MAPAPVTVTLETSLGSIDVEVYPARAPLSAGDFLRYVDRGLYAGAGFYRVVRRDNDHGRPVIEVVQGGLLDESKALPPVAHETTSETGLRHEDGTVSLARGAAGTGGGAAFFICIGPQPGLDFGAKRNSDGLGFAAFGRVVHGMDVVLRIHALPATGKADSEYVRGQILAEPVRIIRAVRR
jgi:peptidyl-prolyl cis-trans isomerase A (cyclophilin A)